MSATCWSASRTERDGSKRVMAVLFCLNDFVRKACNFAVLSAIRFRQVARSLLKQSVRAASNAERAMHKFHLRSAGAGVRIGACRQSFVNFFLTLDFAGLSGSNGPEASFDVTGESGWRPH